MDSLFMADVTYQVHKDWEKRFNKRDARRAITVEADRTDPLRSLVDKLKQAF